MQHMSAPAAHDSFLSAARAVLACLMQPLFGIDMSIHVVSDGVHNTVPEPLSEAGQGLHRGLQAPERTCVEVVAGGDDELGGARIRQLAHQRRHLALVVLALPAPISNLQRQERVQPEQVLFSCDRS